MNDSQYTYFIKNGIYTGNNDVFKTLLDLDNEHTEATEIIFDLSGLKDKNPFNMLLIARKLFRFRNKYPNKVFKYTHPNTEDYLGHMGFYNAMGSTKSGKRMGEARGSNTYIPIHKIDFASLNFYDEIEPLAFKLAQVFQFDRDLAKFLQYAFIETIRNVYEHSQSNKAFVCAQRWITHNLVEIAVLDEGCGVAEAMRRYSKDLPEIELLELSLAPGISAKSNHPYLGRDNEWSNSGYGLYVLKELCKTYKGSFTICSNNYAIRYNAKGEKTLFKPSFNGTAVCLRFSTNENVNFTEERRRIVAEGEKLAKENKKAIKTASKSSGGNYGQA
ncbi:MAG: hypothetical protein K2K85_06985 [Clostridia bacterium]|nr:hypothetical protein [Clostridia bacterium]